MAQQPQNRPLRLWNGPIQHSAVAPQQAERMRTNGVYQYNDTLCEIGTFVANNWGYVTFPVGRYTYRLWNIQLIAPAAIASVTDLREGENVVKTANIADYLDTLIIEINGQAKWELTVPELVKLNAYQNLDTSEGTIRIPFGSPNIHNTDMVEDAYQFGTANLKSVKLRIKTKAAWVTGMRVSVAAEYANVARPIGYFQTTTRYAYTAFGAGNFAISDLAVGIDFSTVWVQGAGIKRAKFKVDDDWVFDCTNWQLRSLHEAWGKDMAALGSGLMFDSFRDGDGIGLDSVSDELPERRRGADVRLELDMASANTPLTVVVFHCGLYSAQ